MSTWERTCEASRPRPARAPHHAPRLPPHTHRPRTRCPLLPLTLPPLSLAFGRRWRRSDSRFRACEKARPQPRSAPAPARPASALLAARGGGRLAPVAGHAAAAVAAARAALTRACVLARAGRFCVLPGAEEDPPHVPSRPDDRPAAARRRRVHHAPSPPSTPPEIHSNTHLHPHNLLLPNPRGEPSVTHPPPLPHVVPRRGTEALGWCLASLSFILKYVCQICTSCVFPFEISGLAQPPGTQRPREPPADGSGVTPHTSPTAIPRHPACPIVRCGALGRERAEISPRRAMPSPSKPIAGPG